MQSAMKKLRRILVLLIISGFSISALNSQTSTIDSFENLLQNHRVKDITRVNLLNETASGLLEKNIKKITGLLYEFDKEKLAIALEQQKKDAVQEEETKRQKIVRNSLILGFIFMVAIVLLVLNIYLQKRDGNRILIAQKKEIEEINISLLDKNEEILIRAEELKTVNIKLQRLGKFKEEMTGMIVHDLKNPLNSVISLAENDIVKQSGKQMLNIVMNILDVQKFEDAEIQLKLTNNSIFEVSKAAIYQVKLLYEQKNIKIKNQIENYVAKIDPEIIERVFVNILTNAIKHTPNNGIITLEAIENLPDYIRVKITNTGMGIPLDKLHSVFGKFKQLKAKKSGITAATGIGLTFCKIFIEEHGGKIGVDSEVGKNTTFWFTLPVGEQGSAKINSTKGSPEKERLILTPEEIEILKPLLSKLQKLVVYESSAIEEILGQIDFSKTENLDKWKRQMDNATYALNEEKYKVLIHLFDT